MKKKHLSLFAALLAGLLLAACAPGAVTQEAMMDKEPTEAVMEEQVPQTGADAMMEDTAAPEMMDKPADPMMENTAAPEMMDKPADPMMEGTAAPEMMEDKEAMMAPGWYGAQLTNVVTGEPFMVSDFEGKVVLVQAFAQWCPTCLSQKKEIARLHELLGMREDLVTLSLDVDPNEDAEMLKAYLDKHGFDWHYAVPPVETIREIGSLYGDQFLNPPSAPMMIIDRHGEAHALPFGVKSAEDLQKALQPYLDGGM